MLPVAEFTESEFGLLFEARRHAHRRLVGADALLNYRVGLDYAHSDGLFRYRTLFNFPDFDVVGLILRPEDDGRFTILGAADFDGRSSVPEGAVPAII